MKSHRAGTHLEAADLNGQRYGCLQGTRPSNHVYLVGADLQRSGWQYRQGNFHLTIGRKVDDGLAEDNSHVVKDRRSVQGNVCGKTVLTSHSYSRERRGSCVNIEARGED